MSSLPRGFEPPAPEDLGPRSLTELREMLRRQERLLRNEKFICRLPDKGKKVLGTVAKLKAAIAEREEVRGKSELFHPISLDYKLRQKAIAGVDVDVDKPQNSDQILDTSSPVPGCSPVDSIRSSETSSEKQGLVHPAHKGSEDTPEAEHTVSKGPVPSGRAKGPSSSGSIEHLPQHSAADRDISFSLDNLLIDSLQRITLAEQGELHSEENLSAENSTDLCSGTPKKPHYMEVLEMRAQNPVPLPHKFKTNMLPSQKNDPIGHCQRGEPPISSEERRRRDKQHLDDITAARLLPLHHLPTQLLPIEESLALQKQQKQSYEEMQAKLAAQKLAERLNIKMQNYNPEGESLGKYREVKDEDAEQSSDDGF
ncbi:protein GRINL1A [Perognathus longimembris pacificus]|uniref:protein GRINL1A n=1 Tax=Perognathus longimembris pacificus TaxID=214514 RepID=UPI00201869A5|nr:protein GRINL1A [Perognathus longimembris pacificus]